MINFVRRLVRVGRREPKVVRGNPWFSLVLFSILLGSIAVFPALALENPCMTIQLGSFVEAENARQCKERMQRLIPEDLRQDFRIVLNPPHYAVRLGFFEDRSKAVSVLHTIQGYARDAFVVETDLPLQSDLDSTGAGPGRAGGDESLAEKGGAHTESIVSGSTLPAPVRSTSPGGSGINQTESTLHGSGNASDSSGSAWQSHEDETAASPGADQALVAVNATVGKTVSFLQNVQSPVADPGQGDISNQGRSPRSAGMFERFAGYAGSREGGRLILWSGLLLLIAVVIGYGVRLLSRGGTIPAKSDTPIVPEDTGGHTPSAIPCKPGTDEQSLPADGTSPPRLSQAFEQRLLGNTRELTMVEANLLSENKEMQVVYVSSCFSGEGKTTAALELAYGLAVQGGRKVLLVDWSDGIMPVSDFFNSATSVFTGVSEGLDDAAGRVHTAYRGLDVLVLSMEARDCSRLHKDEIRSRLSLMCEHYDYIVIDGQSVLGSSFAMYADIFDGIILVVEAEKTKWEVVQLAIDKLQSMGGRVIGTILNKRKYYLPRFLYENI